VEGLRWAFALEVARVARGVTIEEVPDGLHLGETHIPMDGPAPLGSGTEALMVSPRFLRIDYRGQILPQNSPAPFAVVSAGDLLDGQGGEKLQGKAVLIGFGATDLSDRLSTPVSDSLPMPGVEIHANLLDGLLDGRSPQPLGAVIQTLLLFSSSLLSTWLVLRWPGVKGLLALVVLVPVSYAAGYLLFAHAHRLVAFGPLLCVSVLAAPLAQL